jgi:hypothetical protein
VGFKNHGGGNGRRTDRDFFELSGIYDQLDSPVNRKTVIVFSELSRISSHKAPI